MSIEICVSGEELKAAMEKLALIGGGTAGKKDPELKQNMSAIKISAVCSGEDGCYLLTFCCMGAFEQLTYRMDGKGARSGQAASAVIDGRRFISLGRNFSGDVTLGFTGRGLVIRAGASHYEIGGVAMELPELKVPPEGVSMGVAFLQDAVKHCSVAIDRGNRGALSCIQLRLAADGSAVCWSTNRSSIARFTAANTGCHENVTLLLPPAAMQHIADLAEQDEVRIVAAAERIYAQTPRFDYACSKLTGALPDCQNVYDGYKAKKSVRVQRHLLLAAVARASVIAGTELGSHFKLSSDSCNLYIEATSAAGSGLEAVPLEECSGTDDDANSIAPLAFGRLLNGCYGESIVLQSRGRGGAYVFNAAGSENSFMLAPLRT